MTIDFGNYDEIQDEWEKRRRRMTFDRLGRPIQIVIEMRKCLYRRRN